MAQMTITEALAELKTLGKRIEKKQQFVLDFLLRQDFIKDPLQDEGGSPAAVETAQQSIHDLRKWATKIRLAIQKVNLETDISIQGETRSIAEWLVWRREIAPGVQMFLGNMRQRIQQARNEAQKQGIAVRAAAEAGKPNDLIVNIDEQVLAAKAEEIENVLGTLDGQLSLKNATTLIEV